MDNVQRKIPFFKLIYKNLFLEILIVFLCALLMVGYTVATDETRYTVNQSVMLRTSVTSALGNASQSANASHGKLYMPMVKDSITNPEAMREINEIYKERYGGELGQISPGAIKIAYKENSLIFNISYTDLDEKVAKQKLGVVFEVANVNLKEDIKGNVELILTDGVDQNGEIRYHSVETSDSLLRNAMVGVAIGVVVAAAVVFIKYVMDNTVKDKDEFESITGVSVLSFVEKEQK